MKTIKQANKRVIANDVKTLIPTHRDRQAALRPVKQWVGFVEALNRGG